jgi:mannose-6-phosphate isomerase
MAVRKFMENSSQSTLSAWAPFRIAPQFVERVWGSCELGPWYEAPPAGRLIGEVWLTGDACVAASGAQAGKRLDELFAEASEAMLGAAGADSNTGTGCGSPLLIKVIFAKEKLSVQVHPDDRMAQKYGDPRGKAECWYVLGAGPGAQVACGLRPAVTLEEIKAEIKAGTLESSLKMLDVARGEMIFVDAGTVHAIWPGSILLETQQNCDLTYRMYDYGRGRELHINKALEAVRFDSRCGVIAARELADRTLLLDEKYFRVERLKVEGARTSASLRSADETEAGLQYLFVAGGAARISGAGLELRMGEMAAIPAASPEFVVEDAGDAKSARLELMRITPRQTER